MPDAATTSLLLGLTLIVGLVAFLHSTKHWVPGFVRAMERWTAAIERLNDRLQSEEWMDATWREVVTGRRKLPPDA